MTNLHVLDGIVIHQRLACTNAPRDTNEIKTASRVASQTHRFVCRRRQGSARPSAAESSHIAMHNHAASEARPRADEQRSPASTCCLTDLTRDAPFAAIAQERRQARATCKTTSRQQAHMSPHASQPEAKCSKSLSLKNKGCRNAYPTAGPFARPQAH